MTQTIRQDIKDVKDVALAAYTVLSIGLMFTGLGELEVAARALTYGNVVSGIGQSFTGIRDLFSSNVHTRDLGGITLALGATDILFGRIESKQLSTEIQLVSKVKEHEEILSRMSDKIESLGEQRKGLETVVENIQRHMQDERKF